ncbi:filamentous hemagglutinin N-terminal domain-containing protein, partial [Ancylothrix sp. C2]|uniref:two-partner secretion domain-containing protein n=1 Tax=Ancylothrix sp. D3o TaxID=2953691 RepID=UPI0021BA5656
MNTAIKSLHSLLAISLLIGFDLSKPAFSQTNSQPNILPAGDGTGTLVTPNGNRFDIHGGQISGNGANLFHSFTRFGLTQGQIANFQSNPQIQNILGRINGGEASYINGLIQVTGSNANLFLMNPSGIIFGRDAALNVPASFTATAADKIGFGANWFNATGANNYQLLVGAPTAFNFSNPTPAHLVNSGDLRVNRGQNLTLIGGTVINTGTLISEGGNIVLQAVPGEGVVRLSQTGMVLNLEVPNPENSGQHLALPVTELPALLTGNGENHANNLTVNPDGTVQLSNSTVPIVPKAGTVITSGTIDAANLRAGGTGGNVQILGDRLAVIDANIDVSGAGGGGRVFIGGDYKGQGTIPNASRTYVSQGSNILADALLSGDGGRVIVWADEIAGFSGNISARGGSNIGNGGFVEISGKQSLIFDGSVNLNADNGRLGTLLLDPQNIRIVESAVDNDNSLINNGSIFAYESFSINPFVITRSYLESLTGNIVLEATNDITIEDLPGNQLNLQTALGQTVTFKANADGDFRGNFSMNAGDSINTRGGNVIISGGSINTGNINTTGLLGGGNVTISGSFITTGDINTNSSGAAGDITLIGRENVNTGNLNSSAFSLPLGLFTLPGSGGNITVKVGEFGTSSIRIGQINASVEGTGTGGNINLEGPTITPGNIRTSSKGNITVKGQLDIRGDVSITTGENNSGDITLNGYDDNVTFFDNSLEGMIPLGLDSRNSLTIMGNNVTFGIASTLILGQLNVQAKTNVNIDNTKIIARDVTLEAEQDLNLSNSLINTTGNLQLIGQNQVQISDTLDRPLITTVGENLLIQGKNNINIQALEHPLSIFETGGNLSLVSDGTITANGRFVTGGNFLALNLLGNPGNLSMTSISSDGIISSAGDVTFGNYEGHSLKVEAMGNITGGDITIDRPNTSIQTGTDPDIPILTSRPALILRAGVSQLQNTPNIPSLPIGGATFTATETASSGSIKVGNINTIALEPNPITNLRIGGPVILSAKGNINTSHIRMFADYNNDRYNPGFVNLSSINGNITVSSINTSGRQGGDVTIKTPGLFRANDGFIYSEFTSIRMSPDTIRGDFVKGNLFTSILTTGTSWGGGQIRIEHGGRTFIVGPIIESNGEMIISNNRILETNISSDSSFTVGAITANDNNGGFINSFRNIPLTTNDAVGNNKIQITFTTPLTPVPPQPPSVDPPITIEPNPETPPIKPDPNIEPNPETPPIKPDPNIEPNPETPPI